MLPAPLLVDSNRATVTFVSDSSQTGGGFEVLFTAVHKASEAGNCTLSIDASLLLSFWGKIASPPQGLLSWLSVYVC